MGRVVRHASAVLAVGLVLAACGPRFDVAELEASTTGTQTVEVPLAGGETTTGGTTAEQPATGAGTEGGTDDGAAVDVPATNDTGTADTSGDAPASDTGTDQTADDGNNNGAGDGGDGTDDGGGGEDPPAASGADPGPRPGVTEEPCPGNDGAPAAVEAARADLGCILIGVLVPETGAAPVPSDFRQGVGLFWYENAEQGGVNGYAVELVVQDTTSDPNTTVQKAGQLINQVFTIVSLDRLEVHDALGNFMERAGVPQIMVQAPTPAPAWEQSFIISIDHTEQGRAIAQYWDEDLGAGPGGKDVAVIREQTAALKPGTDAFLAEAGQRGVNVVYESTIDPTQTSFTNTVLQLCNSGAEIAWLYMAPTPALTIMQQAATQNCQPTFFANSISWNLDLAQTNPAAPADSGAFSPWVALTSNRAKPYRDAAQKYNGNSGEDLGLAAWGLNEVIHAGLQAMGPEPGRDAFRRGMQQLQGSFDVWAPIDCRGGAPYLCTSQTAVYEDGGTNWTMAGDFRSFG